MLAALCRVLQPGGEIETSWARSSLCVHGGEFRPSRSPVSVISLRNQPAASGVTTPHSTDFKLCSAYSSSLQLEAAAVAHPGEVLVGGGTEGNRGEHMVLGYAV